MVNQKTNVIKTKLIRILKHSSSPVSGEFLRKELHMSRVGVWKHIRSLIKAGYTIRTSHSGYFLVEDKNLLLPWEFPGQEDRIFYYYCVDSTMEIARDFAYKHYPAKTVVIAEKQNNGIGRNKKEWDSKPGGLYFSLILYPEIPVAYIFLYILMASISLIQTIRSMTSLPATIKWPNDILIHGKKVAGILIETAGEAYYPRYHILGIGVNIHNKVKDSVLSAVSLSDLTHAHVYRSSFFSLFRDTFYTYIEDILNPSFISLYKRYSSTIGNKVIITSRQGKRIYGRAVDISMTGDLIVKDNSGVKQPAIFGDCIHIK